MVQTVQNSLALLIFSGWRQGNIRVSQKYLLIGLGFDLPARFLKKKKNRA